MYAIIQSQEYTLYQYYMSRNDYDYYYLYGKKPVKRIFPVDTKTKEHYYRVRFGLG